MCSEFAKTVGRIVDDVGLVNALFADDCSAFPTMRTVINYHRPAGHPPRSADRSLSREGKSAGVLAGFESWELNR